MCIYVAGAFNLFKVKVIASKPGMVHEALTVLKTPHLRQPTHLLGNGRNRPEKGRKEGGFLSPAFTEVLLPNWIFV